MSTKNVMIGVATGLAVGTALGVLFAPAKGSTTRKRIVQDATDYTDDVKEKFNEYVDAISEKYTSIKDSAMEWTDRGKAKTDGVRTKINRMDK